MFVVAGPCAIENRETVMQVAQEAKIVCNKLHLPLYFKSSFDKANRTSNNARGVGLEKGLAILAEVKEKFNLPIVTDVHEIWQCDPVASIADVIQIPAFLSRQTDLIIAAVKTGKTVNIKKGQFMAPWDMKGVIQKAKSVTNNPKLWLTERGTSFGYGRLVVDMTSLVTMQQYGFPIVFDATHSIQQPSDVSGITKGNQNFIRPLLRAAVAVGIDGIFLETHPNPQQAISDAQSQLPLAELENVLNEAVTINQTRTQQILNLHNNGEQPAKN